MNDNVLYHSCETQEPLAAPFAAFEPFGGDFCNDSPAMA
jgi:hypothetical protein